MSGDRLEAEREYEEMEAQKDYEEDLKKFVFLMEGFLLDNAEKPYTFFKQSIDFKWKWIQKWQKNNTLSSVGIDVDDEEAFFDRALEEMDDIIDGEEVEPDHRDYFI